MESLSIAHTKNCYGCGVCALVCSKKNIKIELNWEGFYEPRLIDEGVCNQCGLCRSVCAYSYDCLLTPAEHEPDSYASWSNDIKIRRKCTSGGIGFELAKYLINDGYKACGVKYNPELNRAEHFMASTTDEFLPSIGSKYIQSFTTDGFSQINHNDKFFITGTPCQIDSMRRYISTLKIEDNFLLLDFFCHGVPSINLWNKYLEMVMQQTGKITYASWRNKLSTWHKSLVIGINGNNGVKKNDLQSSYEILIKGDENFTYQSNIHSKNQWDLFYEFFLGDHCLGRACYDKCKYKYDKSAADIRIGDLWGKKYQQDADGVSAVLVLTEKGKNVVSRMDSCTFIKEEIAIVTEGQMKNSPGKKFERRYLLKLFKSKLSINQINKIYIIILMPRKIISMLLRTVNKLFHENKDYHMSRSI